MPELPEVETIKRQLARVLIGRVFKSVEIRLPKQVKGILVKDFRRLIRKSKIVKLERRGKMLIMNIVKEDDILRTEGKNVKPMFLIFHLKMSGQLIFKDKRGRLKGGGHPIKDALNCLPNNYSHLIFEFADGTKLFFNDLRQFGWVRLVIKRKELENLTKDLGPEPLGKNFKLQNFISCLSQKPNSRIYQTLLSQSCACGLGNIYVNESLFYAGIKPTRKNKNIKKQEYKKLYQAIRKILKKAIAARGTSIDKYLDALGNIGGFAKYLKVYQRQGQLCPHSCGSRIKRLKINGRSAFFCQKCQK